MKKILIVLGIITCLFGLTACGNEEEQEQVTTALLTESEAKDIAGQIIGDIVTVVDQGLESQFASDPMLSATFESWKATTKEIGNYQEITGYEVKMGAEQVEIIANIACENGDGKVDIVLDENLQLSSVTTETIKTFGELMKGAALNTLLGMGTVFAVLILIIFVISAFSLIQKFEAKKEKEAAPKAEAIDRVVAQIEENEELSDDTELVAVIAAAIAASEGAASADGFVVRSIKRANTNKWQRA